MTPSIPKTHVLLAAKAPAGVVFYRKSHLVTYCLSLDYAKRSNGYRDKLSKGSRFYGRIFPTRSDVSPDGKLLVYFAMRGKKTTGKSDPSTWTAVCSPPWLRAHLFYPNNSTWGGGGMFLGDHRLIVFEARPEGAGADYRTFRGYSMLPELKSLSAAETEAVKVRFRPPPEVSFVRPTGGGKLTLVRETKPHHLGDYDSYTYFLKNSGGRDVEGAEEIAFANWAGWDIFGRLMVAAGTTIKIFDIGGRRFPSKSSRILDLEAAIA